MSTAARSVVREPRTESIRFYTDSMPDSITTQPRPWIEGVDLDDDHRPFRVGQPWPTGWDTEAID